MGFDRNKWKGSKIASIKKTQEEAKKNEKKFNRNDGITNFHRVEDGRNWFRIAPAHNSNNTPYQPMRSAFMYVETDIWKDGEKTGEKEIKLRKVFVATQHSPKDERGDNIIKKDPIETYIDFVYKQAEEEVGNKEERKKYLAPITGYRANGKWISGIRPSTEFVCYAWDENGNLGRLGLSNSWMKRMNELSLEESDDDIMAIDIFSDPNEGYPLIIRKNRNENNKVEYLVSFERPGKRESWDEFFERVKVTDNQLLELEQTKPLKELYSGVYTMRDFNLALDGLKRFDEKNGYNIFENDEFLDFIEEISKTVPEKDEDDNEPEKKLSSKKETKKEESRGEKAPTSLRMKKYLKEYVSEEYGDDYSLSDLSKAELKKWYNLSLDDEELPFEENNDESKLEKSEKELEQPPTANHKKRIKKEELNKTDADLEEQPDENEDKNISDLRAKLAELRKKRG